MLPERMKPYSLSACLFLLFLYLGVQAFTGERGLLNGAARETALQQRQARLDALTQERADLEIRVRYLRSGNLSHDLLEERARVVLGFADPRDYVVAVSNVTPSPRPATAS